MTVIGSFFPHTRMGAGIGEAIAHAAGAAWRTLRIWGRIMSTRRDLVDMDDRMLQDLGISRAQADFELSQAPWRLSGNQR